tara:strand:- start:138 stop:389 length:252 start_codon:yes stop_codon:yes gene_type:complete
MKKATLLFCFLLSLNGIAKEGKSKVKYKKGKKLNFESLLIEGEQKKPEMSVVTGNVGEKDLGLLKLRKNFNDYMANSSGEKIK